MCYLPRGLRSIRRVPASGSMFIKYKTSTELAYVRCVHFLIRYLIGGVTQHYDEPKSDTESIAC